MGITLIETMPMGEVDADRTEQYLPLSLVRANLAQHYTLEPTDERTGGPARYVRVVETGGSLGFITPLSHNFCESCNRVRLTCTGTLYMCLGQEDAADLRARYGDAGEKDANIIVALGGDGFMLQTLHGFLGRGVPIYGMNFGSVGFLMNAFREDDLTSRLEAAEPAHIHPLLMKAVSRGKAKDALAFNEVSLLRETRQAAKLRIVVDGTVRLDELVCDGILVSTPAGSTAYNL